VRQRNRLGDAIDLNVICGISGRIVIVRSSLVLHIFNVFIIKFILSSASVTSPLDNELGQYCLC
jgi:hypothetical protein